MPDGLASGFVLPRFSTDPTQYCNIERKQVNGPNHRHDMQPSLQLHDYTNPLDLLTTTSHLLTSKWNRELCIVSA